MSAHTPGPRIVGPASEIPWTDRRCTHCEKVLTGRVAWLELDQSSGKYHDRGGVAPEVSQGWFPFGLACARAILRDVEGESNG